MAPTQTSNSDTETFGLIGRDVKVRQIIDTIRRAAPSDASVLIEGESGTGKQLIATAIHKQSQRCSEPFIRINCAGMPPELFEAELFGQIEAANAGTLLIEEIADIRCHLQSKLFRSLQEHKLCRVKLSAQILHYPRPTFYRKLKKFGIKVERALHEKCLT